MYFSIHSIFSAVILALPLSAIAAPVLDTDSSLELRSNWHHSKSHKVTVGAGGKFRYDPQYVHAKVGDYVEFELYVPVVLGGARGC
jgi:plastocyanin